MNSWTANKEKKKIIYSCVKSGNKTGDFWKWAKIHSYIGRVFLLFCVQAVFFQEEELRSSLDPKYQHLQEDLHVEITAFAPPAEAHARIAYALTEVRKYLIPDSNDEIRQEQMREMEIISTNGDVIDNLKKTPSLVLNGSLAGLQSQALSYPMTSHQTSLNLQGLPTVGSNNGFITAPFLAAGTHVNIETNTHTSDADQ